MHKISWLLFLIPYFTYFLSFILKFSHFSKLFQLFIEYLVPLSLNKGWHPRLIGFQGLLKNRWGRLRVLCCYTYSNSYHFYTPSYSMIKYLSKRRCYHISFIFRGLKSFYHSEKWVTLWSFNQIKIKQCINILRFTY